MTSLEATSRHPTPSTRKRLASTFVDPADNSALDVDWALDEPLRDTPLNLKQQR